MTDKKDVKKRIEALEGRYTSNDKQKPWGAWFSLGWRIAFEWAAAVLVGYGIGHSLDLWLSTSPWCLIVFLLLGNVAGLLNIYRTFRHNTKTF